MSLQFICRLCLAIGLFALVGCATSPTGRSQFLIVSPESAIQQSRGAYRSAVEALREQEKLLEDPLLQARVLSLIHI